MCRVNLDKLRNAFDIFHTTTAIIAELGDYDDYENSYTIIEKGTIKGNLQPYSGTLAEKDYGFKEECQYQFYCSQNDNIKAGSYLIIGSSHYKVVYVAEWDMGINVLLREVLLNDRRKQDSQGNS